MQLARMDVKTVVVGWGMIAMWRGSVNISGKHRNRF